MEVITIGPARDGASVEPGYGSGAFHTSHESMPLFSAWRVASHEEGGSAGPSRVGASPLFLSCGRARGLEQQQPAFVLEPHVVSQGDSGQELRGFVSGASPAWACEKNHDVQVSVPAAKDSRMARCDTSCPSQPPDQPAGCPHQLQPANQPAKPRSQLRFRGLKPDAACPSETQAPPPQPLLLSKFPPPKPLPCSENTVFPLPLENASSASSHEMQNSGPLDNVVFSPENEVFPPPFSCDCSDKCCVVV